jgi:hypothetical protein
MRRASENTVRPLTATPKALKRQLADHSILWIGAGASIPAGYPSASKLVQLMKEAADDPLEGEDFPAVADQLVRSRGPGALRMLLQRAMEVPGPVLDFHRAVANLARNSHVHTIITTNYDNLIERAFSEARVPHVVQTFERNFDAVAAATVRILKVHGSQDDWGKVVLSGRSYEQFQKNYRLLNKQLDVLCTQYPLTFIGASLCEPRILKWLATRSQAERIDMLPWRAFLTSDEWTRLLNYETVGVRAREVLVGQFRPLLLDSHEHLSKLWTAVADELAPETKPKPRVPSVPHLEVDWPNSVPERPELEAFLAEAAYRAGRGESPYCHVTLRSLTSARAQESEIAHAPKASPADRAKRVELLQRIDYLEQTRKLIERALEFLVNNERRKEAGWWTIPASDMPLVVDAMLGDDSLRGDMHAWIANNDAQISSWIRFSRVELEQIVGRVLSPVTHLSVTDLPLPKELSELAWNTQYRALGLMLRKMIETNLDPLNKLEVLHKGKWMLYGD